MATKQKNPKVATENLLFVTLTSKIISNTFTYNLLTPNDLPIDAKNMMHKRNIRNGVRNSGPTTDTTAANTAIAKSKIRFNCNWNNYCNDALKYDTPSAINCCCVQARRESMLLPHCAQKIREKFN